LAGGVVGVNGSEEGGEGGGQRGWLWLVEEVLEVGEVQVTGVGGTRR
jgi:hypothetical protein